MKKHIFIAIIAHLSLTLHAQTPKWLKKAREAQVSVIATDTKGELHESLGVFINEDGCVITDFDVIKNAQKASVIDSKGTEYIVNEIHGADNLYNIAKLGISKGKAKIKFIPLAQKGSTENENIYILPHTKADKKVPCTPDTIVKVDTFLNKYLYFTLKHTPNERQKSAPVLNAKGEMIGLLQLPAQGNKNSYAIDAKFGNEMEITPLDAGNKELNHIRIAKSLPAKEADALSFIFLQTEKTDTLYLNYINAFTEKYPKNSAGYTLKAEYLTQEKKYNEAECILNAGLEAEGTQKDEIHYTFSKLIYTFNQSTSSTETSWTLERALSEAEKAYEANPLPVYTNQKGLCLYALKKYNEAAEAFLSLSHTNLRSVDIFLYAAQCKKMAEATDEEIKQILDSAINCFEKPYPQTAAQCFILRGQTLARMQKYREAVKDYNEYEHLAGGNLPARFYYEREQIEVNCRMYPAAMNDIERAIRLAPHEPVFYAECAALNYRVGQMEEAIKYAEKTIEIAPDFADPYRIIGVCLAEAGKTNEAKTYLKKAIDLGDNLAGNVLERISTK